MVLIARSSSWPATRKHSVNPRPLGSTATDDCSVANARSNSPPNSVSAAFSSQTGQSRMSSSTRPPVDVSVAMRDMVRASPTFSTSRSGQ